MQIEYYKQAVKYINLCDKPTKKRLKLAIESIPAGDEVDSIARAMSDKSGTVSHNSINWD